MRMHLLALLIAVPTVVAQPTNQAAEVLWAPPAIPVARQLPRPTVPRAMATSLTIEGFPITLEHTGLEVAARHFRAATGHQGDASEAISWICFSGKDDDGLWGLWLTSGEIDGSAIGGFQWQRLPPGARVDRRCQSLNGARAIKLPVPLRLGMSQAQVERVMGKASMSRGDSSIYYHHHDLTIPTAILGMVWGIAYLLGRRELLPCMVAHFLNDATALPWIGFFMFKGMLG